VRRRLGGPQVEVVLLETPDFFVIEAEHPIWRTPIAEVMPLQRHRGCFIRMHPPVDASDETIARLKRAFEQGGAGAVRVMPRPALSVVPQQALECRPHETVRAVAMQLVSVAQTSRRAALQAAVDEALGAAGL
jgi:hypothetical protein